MNEEESRLEAWLRRRWGSAANEVVGGLVGLLMGLAIVLIGLFDDREDAFPAGRLPVFLAGAAFAAAGASILLQALRPGPRGYRAASTLGVLCGLALLAAPLSFIAGAVPLRTLAWSLVLGLSLLAAPVLAFSTPRSPRLAKRVRLLAAALLVLLAAAAGFQLVRREAHVPPPAASGERLPAEREPPEPGR